MVPKFLRGFEYTPAIAVGNKILIVVQLSGGNDGLNTIIPCRNDIYYSSRQHIAIKKEDTLSLTDELAINSSLKTLKQLYDDGHITIVNGVGYSHPDRSHFRSMDIWQSGSSSGEIVTSGWIGRYLDNACDTCNTHSTLALEADDTLSLAMKGDEKKAIAVKDIERFHKAAANTYFRKMTNHEDEHNAQLASYLYKTLRETTSAADYIYSQSKIYKSTQAYPDTELGKRMKTIGSLIISGTDTRVYYVSHGSFDTHVNQKNRQKKLFEQLDESLASLINDLKANDRFNDVLIMTFSEFGRRVAHNASNGTDHGTASSMFLISGRLKKPGLYNDIPDLTDLDDGDLKHSVDFKQVYSTILDNWLSSDSKNILGKRHHNMEFI